MSREEAMIRVAQSSQCVGSMRRCHCGWLKIQEMSVDNFGIFEI